MNPNRSLSLVAAAFVAAGSLFTSSVAQAQIVVADTYGAPGAVTDNAWVVSGEGSGWNGQWTIGSMFRPTAGGNLFELVLALGDLNGFGYSSTNSFAISLTSVGVDRMPGTVLENWTISGLETFTFSALSEVHFQSQVQPKLITGDEYFILATGAVGAAGAWAQATPEDATGLLNFHSSTTTGQEYTAAGERLGVYRVLVDAAAVPEPSTYGLLGAAVLVGLIWRRMRR